MQLTETLRDHFAGIARPVRCLDDAARSAAARCFGSLPPALATGSHLGIDLSPFGLGECIASTLNAVPVVLVDYLALDASEQPCHVDLRALGAVEQLLRLGVPDKHRKVILRALPPLSREALASVRRLPVDSALRDRVLAQLESVLGAGTMGEQALALARSSLDALGIRGHRLVGWAELYRGLHHVDVMAPEAHRAVRAALLADPETARFIRDDAAPGGATHLYRAVCACGQLLDLTYRTARDALAGHCEHCGRAFEAPSDEVGVHVRAGTLVPTMPLCYHDASLAPGIPCGGGPRFAGYFPAYVAAWTRYYDAVDGPRSVRAAILREDFAFAHQTMFALLFDAAGFPLGSLAAAALGPLTRPEALNDIAMAELQAANARVAAPLRQSAGKFRAQLRPVAHGLPAAHVLARRATPAAPRAPASAPALPRAAIDQSLYACFRTQAAAHHDRVALRAPAGELTYGELARRVAGTAATIRAATSCERVGILCEHDLAMPVAVLAAAAAGTTYVPLDPRYPAAWLETVVADSDIGALVAERATMPLAVELAAKRGLLILELDAAAGDTALPDVAPDALAYLLYTSGTTGRPKGVMQTHRGVLHHVQTYIARLGIAPGDRVALLASYCFDAAVMDIYGALLSGATLVLYDLRASGLGGLADWLRRERVTIFHATPTVYREMLASVSPGEQLAGIRLVVLGGEAATRQDFDRFRAHFAPSAFLVNGLGPTESTLALQFWAGHDTGVAGPQLPVGVAVEHTEVTLIDAAGNPSDEGEIVIASPYVALGYWRDPEQTAHAFVPVPGGRAYRTGDLGRRLPDGNLVFLGRRDFQVKIRGFRIEPPEIEATLRELPALADAAVIATRDTANQLQLVAYVVPASGSAPPAGELRAFVSQRLPSHMVPASFVALAEFPRTPTGKLDRRALPAPDREHAEHVPPRDAVERTLAAIFGEVLGLEQVGIHDDFFALGGHSLRAMQVVARVRSALSAAIAVGALFEAPTVAALADRIRAAGPPAADRIAAGATTPVRLTPAQEQIWFMQTLAPASPAYNLPLALRLRGALDPAALARALDTIVRRHDILRATVVDIDGLPHLRVHPFAPTGLRAERVAGLDAAQACAAADARTPFDLERGPLYRVRLLQLADDDHLLAVTLHHLIGDGWSFGVLERELLAAYRDPAALPELAIQFADFARWVRGRDDRAALAYWTQHVAEAPLVLELPADRTRPPVQTFAGARACFTLPAATVAAIDRLCRDEGVTPFMVTFAIFGTLLHRYTAQDRFLVAVPVANRDRTDTEGLIGLVMNTLVFAIDASAQPTFRELLQRVRTATVDGFAHRELALHRLVEALQPPRDPSRSPVAQVMFVYHDAATEPTLCLGDLTVGRVPVDTLGSKLDLTFGLEPVGAAIDVEVEYSTDLFDRATITRLVGHFERLVDAFVADPGARVGDVPLLTQGELDQLAAWNATAVDYPRDRRIPELFEDQVERSPDAVAIRFDGAELTYRELNARANQLAHRLRKLGVGPDVLVAVYLERSLDMLAGLLGILKAGGAYVPLDPEHPVQRVAFMLDDSAAPVIVTHARLVPRLPAGARHVVCLDAPELASEPSADPPRAGSATDVAYGIYTSGSTGAPKCALVTHRNVVNLLSWLQDTYRLDAGDRVLQKTSLAFDISIPELFWPLLVGASMVVARPEGHKDITYLLELVRTERVTTIHLVPSLLEALADEPALATCRSLRRVLSAGELMSYDAQARFFARSHAELYNLWGPTETTVYSSMWPCDRSADRAPPIGRAIANTQLYVLDQRRQPVPVGVGGEVYIGGDGLARSFLNRPELTAELFVASPFDAGDRLYKSGDLARFLPDGNLEFLGRTDHQVKIRGNRIELGEIEACLHEHAAVRDAVVVALEDRPGQKRLVAYVVADGRLDSDAVRDALRARLPDYMVPSAFVVLAALPLTANGKVDRKALPRPEAQPRTRPPIAPRTSREQLVAGIWLDLLGLDAVGVDDDFYDLGGQSLLAAQIVARIRRFADVDVPAQALLQATTIAEQARVLDGGTARAPSRADVQPVAAVPAGTARAMASQEYFWYLQQSDPEPSSYAVNLVLAIRGPLDAQKLARAVEDSVAAHDVFRTGFRELEGRLFQFVARTPRLELEIADRRALPEAAHTAEIDGAIAAFGGQLDLATGAIIRGRLIAFGEHHHVLVLVVTHAICDGTTRFMLQREIFRRYRGDAEPDQRPSAFLEYAHAFDQFTTTPAGRARHRWWQDRLRGAQPLALPFDFPRRDVDARRDAARHGIVAEPMHPVLSVEVSRPLRAAIGRLADEHGSSAAAVYLATLLRLLQELAHQDDICVETVYDARADHRVEQILGPIATWTPMRFDLSACRTSRDTLTVAHDGMHAAFDHALIPDQFATVPAELRGTCFNYVPRFNLGMTVDNLAVTAIDRSFALFKRHWQLMLLVVDSARGGFLNFTGNSRLWRRETIQELARRYLARLEQQV